MKSTITTEDKSRFALAEGINKIADAVRVTLGGAGRNVIIDHSSYNSPHITKDGVTVARSIFLEDPVEQAGVRLIKNVANTAVEASGDGTTTATVIAQAIVNKGLLHIEDNINPIRVFKGIEKARDEVIAFLEEDTKEIKYGSQSLTDVATISANGDKEIGEIVSKAVTLAGEHGRITVEQSDSVVTSMEHVEGVVVDSGWLSPYFVNNPEKRTVEYDNPMVFITNKKITLLSDMVGLIKISNTLQRPVVIIADEVVGEALQTLIVNSMKQKISVTAIEAPSFGNLSKEYLSDIATITGGTLVSQESGIDLNEVTASMLGQADKIIIDQQETRIIGGKGTDESIDGLINQLQDNRLEDNEKYVDDFIDNRLAKITGGVVVVKVGAETSIELKERRDRFDDAIGATQAAMEQGVIPGGGNPLWTAGGLIIKDNDKSMQLGINILLSAITEPAVRIMMNSGMTREESDKKLSKLDNMDYEDVYDVVNGTIGNCYETGIIDPLKVTLSSLNSAVSIGGILLTTEVAIVNEN